MSGYPKGFLTGFLWLAVGLAVTGLLLIPNMLDLRLEIETAFQLDGGVRMLVGAAHVAGAFLVLALVGSIWAVHMRRGWRARQNRISGAVLTSLWVLLGLTGVGVIYLGDPDAGLVVSAAHTVIGLVIVLALPFHILMGWATTSRSRPDRPL
ncbi:MAG: hypothetical protein Q8L66_03890 [Caulobacter sp.]|nr:hypothetical protein [Caulobacter sp.]